MFKKISQPLPNSPLLTFLFAGTLKRLYFSGSVGLIVAILSGVIGNFLPISLMDLSSIIARFSVSYFLSCALLLEISFHRWTQPIGFVAHKTWAKLYLVALVIFILGNSGYILISVIVYRSLEVHSSTGSLLVTRWFWLELMVKSLPLWFGFVYVLSLYFQQKPPAKKEPPSHLDLDLGKNLGNRSINPQNILSAVSEEHYLTIRIKGAEPEELWVRMSMAQLIDRLPYSGFIQPHRSFLVNLRYTQKMSKNQDQWSLTTEDGRQFQISRRRLKAVKQAWDDWHA